jgi:hypothetical protein
LIEDVASWLNAASREVRVNPPQQPIGARREEISRRRQCLANSNSPQSASACDIDAHYFNFWSTWKRNIQSRNKQHISSQLLERMRRFPAPTGHSILIVEKGNSKRSR